MLLRLEITNFKSYSGFHSISFSEFTAIIGPNGSGKSNLMDAISFVLGVSSGLRSAELQELVYSGSDSSDTACVSAIYSDENGDEMTLKRSISRGSSVYAINGKPVSFSSYCKTLESQNILVKARNFLVFQGDVEAIASQSSVDLTRLIEQISGSLELKPEYERLKTLQEQATQVSTHSFAKKRNMMTEMKAFKEQKEEAEYYSTLFSKKQSLIQSAYLYKLFTIDQGLQESIEALRQEQQVGLEFESEKETLQAKIKEASKSSAKMAKDVLKHDTSIKKVQMDMDALKPSRVQAKEALDFSTMKVTKATSNLEQSSSVLKKQNQSADSLQSELEECQGSYQDHLEYVAQERAKSKVMSPKLELEYNQIKNQVQIETFDDQELIKSLKNRLDIASSKHSQAQESLNDLTTKKESFEIEVKTWTLKSTGLQGTIESTTQEVKSIRKEMEGMETDRRKWIRLDSELSEKLSDVSQRLLEAGSDARESSRSIQFRDRLESMKRMFSGVHGKLLDLCRPSARKYETAVSVILGKHMDSIVVDTEATAIECIQYLKDQRGGQATFLPLDTLVVKPVNEKYRSFAKGAKLALDVIECDEIAERALLFACGNALVCDTMAVARHVCYERHAQVKAVTLDGTVIHKTGMITGGQGASNTRRWEQKDIETLKVARDGLVSKLAEVAKSRRKAEQDDHLFAQVTVLESRLENAKEEYKATSVKLESLDRELTHLKYLILEASSALSQSLGEVESIEKQIAVIDSRLLKVEKKAYSGICKQLGIASIRDYITSAYEQSQTFAESELKFTTTLAKLRNQLHLETQRSLETAKRVERLEEAIDSDSETLKAATAELETIESKMKAFEKKRMPLIKALDDSKAVYETSKSGLADLKKELAQLIRDHETVANKLSTLESQIEGFKAEKMSILRKCKLEEVDIAISGEYASLDDIPLDSMGLVLNEKDEDDMDLDAPLTLPNEMRDVHVDFKALDKKFKKQGDWDRHFTHEIKTISDELEHLAPNMRAIERMDDMEVKLKDTTEEFDQSRQEAKKARDEFLKVKQERYKRFHDAFTHISSNIDVIYKKLTVSSAFKLGGTAYLSLEGSDEPYLDGVKYHAMPPMKRFREMELLSGGEKTVAALALLFAIHSYRPSPFFILDEVDAALDNTNVVKVLEYIQKHSRPLEGEESSEGKKKRGKKTEIPTVQFIVISLKSLFYSGASSLVGIYRDIEESSSKLLTLDLSKYASAL